ncbi:hypothetical protein A2130_04930 [Candidatus Woesebacteria bacterium GWC2_33_12]|uniref:DUF541 domain-containing protein n=1 Tax=Candidatus Woesebacteria bacterium GW2011_GWB1_33_22 TaxID=1618566 RepID=A0A0G0CMM4_9BACT|nr:MAG: hypothetical protein UR29_C0011G0018 [Candidatus Woesebacteria bacterium GW2011_GWC2_33_12]KKP41946.1 MAG: hypothetical protein UR33_C0007G0009 [Candidatus Woesebacteria bacterium GW2011_GWA2_33_20]KKP44617.1 MAG: hypothetical protein UR35_C0007G0033 [Candidatus Woesebacteria bacterium GW2011_GWB1_33_22]KKP46421.1 MAG: hypothetical protein UR37_C0008G0033 [Microgenomates group bacterium GW2011_GWC1_33_28]KKP50475.1 MAG: hypothetical protein UR41_C0007G0033 [Candidatus Woesebacteria bact
MEPAVSVFKKYLGLIILGVFFLVLYQIISSPMVTTVTGVGSVSSPAKTATITFSLSSSKDNPREASNEVISNVTKVKETLKTSGIPESDIYESQVTIYPASAIKEGASGFQATSSMGIKTTQLNNLNGIITTLYGLGAVVVTQPVLEVGDKEALEKEAYALALKDAKKKANTIALKNLKFLKKIVLIQETTSPTTSTVTSKLDTVSQLEKNLPADTGVIKVSKVLTVGYKMW